MKKIFLFCSLVLSLSLFGQTSQINYYKILRLDTVDVCNIKNPTSDQMTQCQLRFIDLISERWWESYGEMTTGYSRSIWFYGDCEDQKNFTFDSVSVNITIFGNSSVTEKYMFTPKEAEQFFMKKK